MGGDGFAVAGGGLIAVLAEGIHCGFVKRGRAGEDFHRLHVAGLVDDGVEGDVAGDVVPQCVGGSDRAHGLDELRRNDSRGVVGKSGDRSSVGGRRAGHNGSLGDGRDGCGIFWRSRICRAVCCGG